MMCCGPDQELGLRPYVVHEVDNLADKEVPRFDTIVVDSLSTVSHFHVTSRQSLTNNGLDSTSIIKHIARLLLTGTMAKMAPFARRSILFLDAFGLMKLAAWPIKTSVHFDTIVVD